MKNAIVIGATSGIGREIAKFLVDDNFRVVITGRRGELLEEIRREKPSHYISQKIDIVNVLQTTQTLNSLAADAGEIELIVLCSGIGGDNEEPDTRKELEIVNTNVVGFTNLVNWAFNFFLKQGHGHLAAITSVAGVRGSRRAPAYFSSKAFQIRYLESFKQLCFKMNKNILITDIRPGFVDTDMLSNKQLIWTITAQKAAKQIYQAIKSRKRTVYVTQRWRWVSYVLRLIPQAIYNRL